LIVYDPDRSMVVDSIPCEDGHSQERAMLGRILGGAQADDLRIEDRSFSREHLIGLA
jgi:hypothetical protein